METRPRMVVLAPSEVSPGPRLCHGVLWASRAAPCTRGAGGDWAQGRSGGGRHVSQCVVVPWGLATFPLTHPHACQI